MVENTIRDMEKRIKQIAKGKEIKVHIGDRVLLAKRDYGDNYPIFWRKAGTTNEFYLRDMFIDPSFVHWLCFYFDEIIDLFKIGARIVAKEDIERDERKEKRKKEKEEAIIELTKLERLLKESED